MYKKKKFSLVITTVILMLLSFPFQSSVFAEEYLAQLANPVEAEVEQNLVCQTETISSTETYSVSDSLINVVDQNGNISN